MRKVYYWHVHHEVLFEALTEPIENRIQYIKNNKPAHEIETRLRLMKPIQGRARAEYEKVRNRAFKKIEALHKIQCPNCPWDGKTIFPNE